MAEIQDEILGLVARNDRISDSLDLKSTGNQLLILGVLNSLKSRLVVDYTPINIETFVPTEEGYLD
jgi:hypothetical protein